MIFEVITEPFDERSIEYLSLFSNLLSENFEDKSELESIENWTSHSDRYSITTILAIENANVVGGILFEKYKQSNCYLCTYLCVSQEIRGSGLSKALVEKMISSTDGIIFAECRDPEKLESPSDMDKRRISILSKLGAKYVNHPYFQPPLKDHVDGCDHLMLLTFNDLPLEPDVLFGFLSDFYNSLDYTIPVLELK